MMILSIVLAQIEKVEPVPALTFETIGIFFVLVVVASRWVWDFLRHRRDERAQFEIRHDPPIHKEYTPIEVHRRLEGRVGKIEERYELCRAECAERIRKVDEDRRTSVTEVYIATERSIKEVREELRADNQRIHERLDSQTATTAEMAGTLKQINQSMVQLATKLDRQIERSKREGTDNA